ncbi:cation-translocating P-type ATPase [Mucilaginibacter aquariorum]|uniref:Cation-translocating P-type ATPase n=1 Tax=Mucilaginibacter aquariorum TaxID=2967225 RepID=A0ABT1T2C8_9SPHI|nr:cation-translocating P-type ATPase [Mucilaginibacter aquariorum]MCQ6958771.1 cation-translocating P-type ATPase [Mucilaginibacter aquariorum]
MSQDNHGIQGLSGQEVLAARAAYGTNRLSGKRSNRLIDALIGIAKEPMVVLLLVTSCIYFISGEPGDGAFLAAAILLVAGISLYQDTRSHNALEKLKDYSQPRCKVIRDSAVQAIKSEDMVVGDSLMVEEGTMITADGVIAHANDFSVNESVLTGESLPVYKDGTSPDNHIFHGTTVASGLAIATVTAVGNQTRLGRIGKSLESITEEKTPLELQINNFVRKMVIAGLIVFIGVWAMNYYRSPRLLDSLIKALTLAMSVLPEEIPVAFTTFMALGAWRMMKMGIVVKQMKTVETLGSASIICIDKTGTITENKMSLAKVYLLEHDQTVDLTSKTTDAAVLELLRLAMWASEPIPFDPMEAALHEAYTHTHLRDERSDYHMIHEYPLNGQPPMMTHLFENKAGKRLIASKGAPEAYLKICRLTEAETTHMTAAVNAMSAEGYRVLAVAESTFNGNDFPARQQDFDFRLKGLVAFYDPPKDNIKKVLKGFYQAGVEVKIITGDNAATTMAIARQINFEGVERSTGGEALMELSDQELAAEVKAVNIFTRMFPEAKLKIINALKAQKEIVAMTGDGVNDGPALKAAHIGIAMGKKGTEIAKEAASLILLEDDLSKMVTAVAMGRRIYANLKKAIQYIISIHIPIILTVFFPLALGWVYPNIFSPVHIIFLELIMGPTCSIIYENEPMEKNTMHQSPRPFSTTFFNWQELMISVVQGLAITTGTLLTYRYAVTIGANEQVTRTMVFVCLITANIWLTLVNRSFHYSLFTTVRYKNNLVLLIIGITIFMAIALIYLQPLTEFFELAPLSIAQLMAGLAIGFVSVIWFEAFKWWKRRVS